jgi:hypothetical protein
MHQLFFGLQPMGPGEGPSNDTFKPKLYNSMEGNKSVGGSAANLGTSSTSGTSGASSTSAIPATFGSF